MFKVKWFWFRIVFILWFKLFMVLFIFLFYTFVPCLSFRIWRIQMALITLFVFSILLSNMIVNEIFGTHFQSRMDSFLWFWGLLLLENWTVIELSLFHIEKIRITNWGLLWFFLLISVLMNLGIVWVREYLWIKANNRLEAFLWTTIKRLLLWRMFETE